MWILTVHGCPKHFSKTALSEVSSICGYGWDDQMSLKYVANHGFVNLCVTLQDHDDVKTQIETYIQGKNTKSYELYGLKHETSAGNLRG